MQPVRALAADLDRGRRRNRKFDDSPQLRQPRLELLARRCLVFVDDLALRVSRRRARPEVDLRDVALVEPDEPRLELRGGAGEEQEEPGGERV